jgi:PTS system mannose-specific IID component
MAVAMNSTPTAQPEALITKKEIRATFWRQFFLQASWNYERMQALGYCYIMMPVLRKLYKNKPEMMQAAVKRHLEFFNTQPYMAAPILGFSLAMEEQLARGEDIDPASINAVKVGLMGPLAGVGDSMFWLTFRPIAFSIGIAMAMTGNILGPIIALVLFNAVHIATRWYGLTAGYNQGLKLLKDLQGGAMRKLTEGAGVLAMMVAGAMIASMIPTKLTAVAVIGKTIVKFQDVFDSILPGAVPLGLTFLVYWGLRKRVSPTWLLLILLVVGVLGRAIHLWA